MFRTGKDGSGPHLYLHISWVRRKKEKENNGMDFVRLENQDQGWSKVGPM